MIPEINADSAAKGIIATVDQLVEAVLVAQEQSEGAMTHDIRNLLNYLIRKAVWRQLTTRLEMGPDELHEAADALEAEEIAEDEEEEAAEEGNTKWMTPRL